MRNASGSLRRRRSTWKAATPLSSQHTTSPSIRQERTLRWFTASNHQREAGSPVIAAPGQQSDAHRIATGHQPIAIVVDLANSGVLSLSWRSPTRHNRPRSSRLASRRSPLIRKCLSAYAGCRCGRRTGFCNCKNGEPAAKHHQALNRPKLQRHPSFAAIPEFSAGSRPTNRPTIHHA